MQMPVLPPCDLVYLLELGKMHKQYPNLEIFQVDALLRANSHPQHVSSPQLVPASVPTSPTTEAQLQHMIKKSARDTPSPLNSDAQMFEPPPSMVHKLQIQAPVAQPIAQPVAQPVAQPMAQPMAQPSNFRVPMPGPRRGRATEPKIHAPKSWANIVEEAE
jgi:hypothetical protein